MGGSPGASAHIPLATRSVQASNEIMTWRRRAPGNAFLIVLILTIGTASSVANAADLPWPDAYMPIVECSVRVPSDFKGTDPVVIVTYSNTSDRCPAYELVATSSKDRELIGPDVCFDGLEAEMISPELSYESSGEIEIPPMSSVSIVFRIRDKYKVPTDWSLMWISPVPEIREGVRADIRRYEWMRSNGIPWQLRIGTTRINPDGTVIEPPAADGTVTLERHNVRFVADTNQLYGFDDITSPSVPWKSVEVGSNDVVGLSVDLETDCTNVHLVAGQAETTISPSVGTKVACVATVGRSASGTGTVGACYLATNGTALARMSVAAYSAITNRLLIVPLNEHNDDEQRQPVGTTNLSPNAVVVDPGDDLQLDSALGGDDELYPGLFWEEIRAGNNGIAESVARTTNTTACIPFSAAEISNYLNRVYAQALVRWEVEMRPAESMNYDVDRDGRCFKPRTLPGETGPIHARFSSRIQNSHEFYLVIIGTEFADTNLHGTGVKWGSRVVVVTQGASNILDVCAHELGHCLWWIHPKDEAYGGRPPMRRCLMWHATAERTGTLIRRAEWEKARTDEQRFER